MKRYDMSKCALCYEAPCDRLCPQIRPSEVLRSIWLGNEKWAAGSLPEYSMCMNCRGLCEQECIRPGEVPIRELMNRLYLEVRPTLEIPIPDDLERLRTEICGVPLENPFLLSSSVVSSTYDMCARAFEAGWAGASFKTVCSFDIREASPRFSAIRGSNGEIIGFKNIEQLSDHSVAENMEIFRKLKEKYPSKVIIASIMGQTDEEWTELAGLCESNGADLVELNFSCPNMVYEGAGTSIGQVPELVERYTAAARRGCSIPVLAKLTPNVASMVPAALAAKRGGADGISAINTIFSVVGVNPYTYVSSPAVHGMSSVGGYSGNAVKPIALRFIFELAKEPELAGMYLSGMGGIETWQDALEFLLLGAGSVQVTTAVMQYGYRIIDDLKTGLNYYLAETGCRNVSEIRGGALDFISETTDVIERDTILFPVFHPDRCIGCGRCMISCTDGGHQAITLQEDRKPKLNGSKCVGCHLCLLVCPQGAITPSRKRVPVRRKEEKSS